MNSEKSFSSSKYKRGKRQKNKYSRNAAAKKTEDEKSKSIPDNAENSSDENESDEDSKYSSRKIENNWDKYDRKMSDYDSGSDSTSKTATSYNRRKGKDTKVKTKSADNNKSDYVPIEVLSSVEIQKQLKMLPDPKPPRSAIGSCGLAKKDTSIEDASFWYDVLPDNNVSLQSQQSKQQRLPKEANKKVDINKSTDSKPQRQQKPSCTKVLKEIERNMKNVSIEEQNIPDKTAQVPSATKTSLNDVKLSSPTTDKGSSDKKGQTNNENITGINDCKTLDDKDRTRELKAGPVSNKSSSLNTNRDKNNFKFNTPEHIKNISTLSSDVKVTSRPVNSIKKPTTQELEDWLESVLND